MAFSGASHRPHSSGACPPRGQSSGPLSPESPRPLRATEVPGPVVLQPRRLPTPSRSGDLWTFLGAPPRSSTRMTSGRFGFPVGCRGHGHPRVRRVVRTPPPGCEHTGEQILLMRHFHFTSLHDPGGHAEGRKRKSPACRARVQDFAQWPISTAVHLLRFGSSCRRACAPDELNHAPLGRNGPIKTRFQGWR